jgi:putative transposase
MTGPTLSQVQAPHSFFSDAGNPSKNLFMARRALIRSELLPYHIFARSNNREWFSLPKATVWEIIIPIWKKVVAKMALNIHHFVLMSNHFHLIASTPLANLDEIMLYFMRETARKTNFRASRINHVFGGPYKSSLIRHQHHYEEITRYVYLNPVEACMTERVQDYPYSTRFHKYEKSPPLELVDSCFDCKEEELKVFNRLDFLNTRYSREEKDAMKRGLRRRTFEIFPHRRTRFLPTFA